MNRSEQSPSPKSIAPHKMVNDSLGRISLITLKSTHEISNEEEVKQEKIELRKKLVISGFSGIKNDHHNSYDTPIFRNQERSPLSTFNYINLPSTCKNSEILYAEVIQKIQYQFEYRERPLKKPQVMT